MARLVVIGAVLFLCVFIPMNAVQEEWDNDALELGAAEGVDGVEGSEHVQPFVDDDSEGADAQSAHGMHAVSETDDEEADLEGETGEMSAVMFPGFTAHRHRNKEERQQVDIQELSSKSVEKQIAEQGVWTNAWHNAASLAKQKNGPSESKEAGVMIGQAGYSSGSTGKGKGKGKRKGNSKAKPRKSGKAAYASAAVPLDPTKVNYNVQLMILYQEKIAQTMRTIAGLKGVEQEVEREKLVSYKSALASVCKNVAGGTWTRTAYASSYSSSYASRSTEEHTTARRLLFNDNYTGDAAVQELGASLKKAYASGSYGSGKVDPFAKYKGACKAFLAQNHYSSGR